MLYEDTLFSHNESSSKYSLLPTKLFTILNLIDIKPRNYLTINCANKWKEFDTIVILITELTI